MLPDVENGRRSPFQLLSCDAPGLTLTLILTRTLNLILILTLALTLSGGDNNGILAEDFGISWMLGQRRQPAFRNPFVNTVSVYYPENLADGPLYPEASSTYIASDGTELESACFVPKEVTEIAQADCPSPFVNPVDPNSLKACVQACPIAAYSDSQYSVMWAVFVGIGTIGFALNVFVAVTWGLGGKKHFDALPFQLKFCVFAGMAYFLFGTLPSLVLKYDLPCECPTEECTGYSHSYSYWFFLISFFLPIIRNLRDLRTEPQCDVHSSIDHGKSQVKRHDMAWHGMT